MTIIDDLINGIRGHAPSWSYTVLMIGWRTLTVLTLITVVDMGYRLFRRDHGLLP